MLKKTKAGLGGSALAIGLLAATVTAADTGRNIDLENGHGRLRLGNAVTVGTYQRAGRVNSIYGPAFSTGVTAAASAEAFLAANAGLLRTEVADLAPIGPFPDGAHLVPTGYDRATGEYKHTIVGYTQFRDRIPVFRGSVKLIVLNEPGFPLILVNNALRDLGDFRPNMTNLPSAVAHREAAAKIMPHLDRLSDGGLVIWAGVNDVDADPVLARVFDGEAGDVNGAAYERWLVLVDARTGNLLYAEDRVLHVDVFGNTSGNVTQGVASDECGPEAPTLLPHMEVSIGGTQTYSGLFGEFAIPNEGSREVTVDSPMRGRYFFVVAEQGVEDDLSLVVTPPGPANFLHNGANDQEFIRSQSNAYYHANLTRDTALFYNPAFPTVGAQEDFQINVNRDSVCNATYNPPNGPINFYASGGGCPNSALSAIIHHEYGHHLVEQSNAGEQGQYGEGYGDVMGVFITDDPGLGYGFFGACGTPGRTAESDIQYPCSGEIHACGVLIAACVWDTRNELVVTEPAGYTDVLGAIIYNAMPLHAPSDIIAPDITIDYITADDDDGNILNGSPHYAEINAGFSLHNMAAPPLVNVEWEYPDGIPTIAAPGTGETFRVNVVAIADDPVAGSGRLHAEVDDGGVVVVSMNEITDNMYEATLPAADCGSVIRWWVSTDTVASGEVTDPAGAPTERYATAIATSETVAFADDGETDPGWTVSGDATDGQWDRGVPVDCDRGDPDADGDGSGQCWLTDNSDASGCNSDVDGGHTILTSPVMDATGGSAVIAYRRWYSNTAGSEPNADTMIVDVSDDGGSTWITIDTVGPGGAEADDGWFDVSHDLADVSGFAYTDQFRIRFDVSDLAGGSVVEAGIDAVVLTVRTCDEADCPQDLDMSGAVDFGDINEVLANWGGGGPDGDANGDGAVNFEDILAIIANWGPCA